MLCFPAFCLAASGYTAAKAPLHIEWAESREEMMKAAGEKLAQLQAPDRVSLAGRKQQRLQHSETDNSVSAAIYVDRLQLMRCMHSDWASPSHNR